MLESKTVTVLGGGLSGRAAARLAQRLGAEVTLSDLNAQCPPLDGVHNEMGAHPDSVLEADIVVVSPGIPVSSVAVSRALEGGAEVYSELGFAGSLLNPEIPVLAVTGTNGKSTVTSFCAQLLKAAGWNVFSGGNLGVPLSEAVGHEWDAVVVEVSSYQMELPRGFVPDVAVVLNLSPDHLARHGDMDTYAAHKVRLLKQLHESGVGVLPLASEHLDAAARDLACDVLHRLDAPGSVCLEDAHAEILGEVLALAGLRVPGELNRWNAAVAGFLVRLIGLPHNAIDPESLVALDHRMQPVESSSPIRWINDSKATNVEATLAGVSGLDGRVWLLLGGQGKEGANYSSIRSLSGSPVEQFVVFGEAADEISSALDGLPVSRHASLESAVEWVESFAEKGVLAVLSPACASFDEFDNFSHRGDVFQELVKAGSSGRTLRRSG